MALPPIHFELLDQTGLAGIEEFGKLARKVEKIGRSSGASGNWFEYRCQEFIRAANNKQSIQSMLDDRRDARVVLQLWLTNDFFRSACPPSRRALLALVNLLERLRPNHCYDLIQVYLLYYREVDKVTDLGELVQAALKAQPDSRLLPYARRLRANADLIFSPEAPRNVAKAIARAEKEFALGMEAIGISPDKGGQFMESCRRAYFVETVRTLLPGEKHKVFRELSNPEIKESPFDGRLNVGQAVCAVMIDKCTKLPKGMPDDWLQLVLNILGDPRRPKSSRDYQRWWSAMDQKHEQLLRRWLAGLDLQLFLKILEDCSSDADLRRMYPARKAFLQGLLKHYDVEDARLFVGRDAASYIRKEYGPQALLAHGLLGSKTQSVIYLRVAGLHLFEGTHSYAARLSSFFPNDHAVLTRSQSHFDSHTLTTGLHHEFEKATGARDGWFHIVHRKHWQAQLLQGFEELGLRINPQHVLTTVDYQEYRRIYGVQR